MNLWNAVYMFTLFLYQLHEKKHLILVFYVVILDCRNKTLSMHFRPTVKRGAAASNTSPLFHCTSALFWTLFLLIIVLHWHNVKSAVRLKNYIHEISLKLIGIHEMTSGHSTINMHDELFGLIIILTRPSRFYTVVYLYGIILLMNLLFPLYIPQYSFHLLKADKESWCREMLWSVDATCNPLHVQYKKNIPHHIILNYYSLWLFNHKPDIDLKIKGTFSWSEVYFRLHEIHTNDTAAQFHTKQRKRIRHRQVTGCYLNLSFKKTSWNRYGIRLMAAAQ